MSNREWTKALFSQKIKGFDKFNIDGVE